MKPPLPPWSPPRAATEPVTDRPCTPQSTTLPPWPVDCALASTLPATCKMPSSVRASMDPPGATVELSAVSVMSWLARNTIWPCSLSVMLVALSAPPWLTTAPCTSIRCALTEPVCCTWPSFMGTLSVMNGLALSTNSTWEAPTSPTRPPGASRVPVLFTDGPSR